MQKLIIIAIFMATTMATAETVYLNKSADEPYTLEVLDSNAKETLVRFRLNNFEREQLSIHRQKVSTIKIAALSNHNDKGLPALPKLTRNIVVPHDSAPEIHVSQYNSTKMDLGTIVPSKGTIYRNQIPDEIPYTFGDFYRAKSEGTTFPATNLKLKGLFTLRDMQGLNFEINPMVYDAASGKTEVIENLVFSIRHNSPSGQFLRGERKARINVFSKVYANHFMNWQAVSEHANPTKSGASEIEEAGDLLIISADKFADELGEFVAWKRKMGYPTKLVKLSDVGRDYRALKKYIQGEYDKEKTLAFVLLVGDAEDMPFHPGKSGNASGNEADPMYGLVEGGDSYPDLIVGRFSAKNSTELANIVRRSIDYEKSPEPGDWYESAAGIASNEGSPTDYQRANRLKKELLSANFNLVDDHYDPGANAAAISSSVNSGRGVINYIGHGSQTAWITGRFSTSHVKKLTNSGMLPMIISVACVNGDFNYRYGDSFAEAWLKAGTADKPAGAIAIFASSTNQSWVPPTVGQLKIAKLIAADTMHTIGGLMFNGSIAVLEDGDSTAKQTFETWHIFGDPTIRLQTSEPQMSELIFPESIDARTWLRNLNLGRGDLHLAITKDQQLIASAVSEPSGQVRFKNGIEELRGVYSVTVSGAGFIPTTAIITFN